MLPKLPVVLSFSITLAIFSASSVILNFPELLYFGVIQAFAAAIIVGLATNSSSAHVELRSFDLTFSQDLAILVIPFCLVIVSVYLWPFQRAVTDIGPLDTLNLASSLLFSSFYPGYLVLKVFFANIKFPLSAFMVLSNLVSMLISALTTFAILLIGANVGVYFPPMILILNLFLLAMASTKLLGHRAHPSFRAPRFDLLALSIVTILSTAGSFFLAIINFPISPGDMFFHSGTAVHLQSSLPVTYVPYFFHLYLAGFFSLCSAVPQLAYRVLYVLAFTPILAFYAAVREWFSLDVKGLTAMATALGATLGFGSLYALAVTLGGQSYEIRYLLGLVSGGTYDVFLRVLLLPDGEAPVWVVGLPCFFALIFLLRRTNRTKQFYLLPMLVVLGYLAHEAEIAVLSALFLGAYLLRPREVDSKYGLYCQVGMAGVALADIATGHTIYITSNNNVTGALQPSITFVLTSFLFLTPFLLNKIGPHPARLWRSFSVRFFLRDLLRSTRWIVPTFYAASIAIWFIALKNGYYAYYYGEGFDFVPFFVWPMRLGAIGLLAVATWVVYFEEILSNSRLVVFASFVPIALAMEQISDYIPLYPSYRFASFAFIGLAVVAGYGLLRAGNALFIRSTNPSLRTWRINFKKGLFVGLILLIVIPALLTTPLYYRFSAVSQTMSQGDLAALSFLQARVAPSQSVLSFPPNSPALSIADWSQDAQRWSKLLLNSQDPYLVDYILASSNIRYVYATTTDISNMKASHSMFMDYLNLFRLIYNRTQVLIYQVPQLSMMSSVANTGIFDCLSRGICSFWFDDTGMKYAPILEDKTFQIGWYPEQSEGNLSAVKVDTNGGLRVSYNSTGQGFVAYSKLIDFITENRTVVILDLKTVTPQTFVTIHLYGPTGALLFYASNLTARTRSNIVYQLPVGLRISKIQLLTEVEKTGGFSEAEFRGLEIASTYNETREVLSSLVATSLGEYTFLQNDSAGSRMNLGGLSTVILTRDMADPPSQLLLWVRAGGTLVVLGGGITGYFSQYALSNALGDLGMTSRDLGSGKIVYVNPLQQGPSIFWNKLVNILRSLFFNWNAQVSPTSSRDYNKGTASNLPNYNWSLGAIDILGTVKISTQALSDYIQLPIKGQSSFAPPDIRVNGPTTISLNEGSYVLSPLNNMLSLQLSNEQQFSFTLDKIGNSTSIESTDGYIDSKGIQSLVGHAKEILLSVNSDMSISGKIVFEQLDAYAVPFVWLGGATQDKTTMNGMVHLQVGFASQPTILFNYLKVEGTVLRSSLEIGDVYSTVQPFTTLLFSSILGFLVIWVARSTIRTLRMKGKIDEDRDLIKATNTPSRAVTGGAGFVGTFPCHSLASVGSKLTVLHDLSTGEPSKNRHLMNSTDSPRIVRGDCKSPRDLRGLLANVRIIFHLAANPEVRRDRSNPSGMV